MRELLAFIFAQLNVVCGIWLLGVGFSMKKNEPFWKSFYYWLAFINAVAYVHFMNCK